LFGLCSPILEITNHGGANHVTSREEVHSYMARRIKVKGIRKSEIDSEQLALVYWLQAKRVLREKRERDVAEKKKRRERER
jgi:hypothetical protein